MIWKKVSLLALLLGICAISLTGFPACTSDTKPTTIQPTETKAQAIVNGNKDNGYPAAGALTDNAKSNFCTGTLIAPRVVLTAAHCIDAFAQLQGAIWFRIDIPVDQSSYTSIYKEIDRTATVKHPSYSAQQNNIANDIALAILKTPAFEIAPMPWNTTKMDQSYVGKDLFFMGYGRLNAASQTPAKQKYSTTLTINGVDTAGKVNTVAYAGNNTSVCQGDSGGPAMLDINGVTYVIGVTSHGTAFNCTGTSYSYRTDPYVSWIEGILKQYNTCSGATPTCGSCGSCQNDSCQPKAVSAENTNCKVCQSDADCGTGVCVTIGSGKRCAQLCDSGCCPVGHECTTDSQKRAYCLPTSMRCPPAKCTTDKDCTSTEACKNGTCVLRLPDLAKTTCQPCSSQTACGTGGYCDAPDGRGGRCLQACSQTGDLCPTGFTCKQLGPGLKQCVPKDGTCWVNCKQASDCTGGLSCIDGICQRPGGSDFGEPCDKQLKCKTGLECINIGTGGGRCYQPCGVPKGTAGAPCKEGNVCDAGLRCFSNPLGGGAVCVEPCAGGSACKNGGSCIPGINICSCQSDSQCSNGAKCNPVIPGFAGACSSATSKPCPAGEECNSTPGEASYCVRKGTGTQSVGEPATLSKDEKMA
jgi:V8-like Glu-specific endopeptidase